MPDRKISDLPQDSSPATDDLLVTVDVSDATDDPAGSSRKVRVGDLPAVGIAKVTGLQAALDGKAAAAAGVLGGGTTGQVYTKTGSGDNAAGWATPASGSTTLTGNVTGTGTGTVSTTIGAGVVTASMLAGSIPASKLVGSDISIAESQVTGLASDLTGIASSLAAKAADNAVVHLTGPETIAGAKTFSSTIVGSISGTAGGLSASIAESQVTNLVSDLAGKLAAASNLSDVASAATARSNLGVAPALTWTPVKTANYSGAAGECVPVDTTSGAVTVTLPASPANKTPFAVKHIIQGGSNAVTYQCGGSDVFNKAGGSTTGTLPLVNQGVVLVYDSVRSVWGIVADDITLSSLDARFATAAQGSLAATAVQPAALSPYATLASPTFTGTVTLPVGLTGLAKLTAGVVSAATAGTDYVKPGGVSGGQTVSGDTASGGNLALNSTSHATKGRINLNGTTSFVDPAGSVIAPILGVGTDASDFFFYKYNSFTVALSMSSGRFSLVSGGTAVSFFDTNGALNLNGTATVAGTATGTIQFSPRTASSLSGSTNNYSPTAGGFQRWSASTPVNVTGMVAGQPGEMRYIWNVGSSTITLTNQDASSTAANRWLNSTGADLAVPANRCALAMYDSTTSCWRVTLLP